MSKEDLEISSLSYVNKDFGSIYPETLDLAKRLTNKWDPSQSNESDPGVVLLKEAAFVADHINYNIDKNILENFLPSATQDKSVRNITEMNGYTPRYYVSAEGKVLFNYKVPEDATNLKSFIIPAFTLVVGDEDGTVNFTQKEDLVVPLDSDSKDSVSCDCSFIEGTLQSLTVNDSSVLTLVNLDDNNRVYFPEVMVAQNGVYVRHSNEKEFKANGYWKKNDYLLTQPSGSMLYKIDYDSDKGLPYIEFPSDIANIIGDGVIVNYIATSGTNGNVTAKTINTIITPSEFLDRDGTTRTGSEFSLSNEKSFVNGKDPETIDEMYKSFKKIVGTFDTLVTCNDYTNAIKAAYNDNNMPLVSNVIVTDRRNDYNKAVNVVTFDVDGAYTKNISLDCKTLAFKGVYDSVPSSPVNGCLYAIKNDTQYSLKLRLDNQWQDADNLSYKMFTDVSQSMSPYDLSIYALKAYAESDFIQSAPYNALENSFLPSITIDDASALKMIKSYVDENKCICHSYNDPASDDVYFFKNLVPLTVSLKPYNKVTQSERASILTNVYKAISNNYNPSNLEYGEEIDTTKLKEVIIMSDERIRDADISSLEYTTYARTVGKYNNKYDNQLTNIVKGDCTLLVDLIAKNILAGRVCLFDFDDNFSRQFGQINGKIYNDIKVISSEVPIEVVKGTSSGPVVSEDTSITSKIKIVPNEYSYILSAPSKQDGLGNYVDFVKGENYTLQYSTTRSDVFELYRELGDGSISHTLYKPSETVSYTISFNNANLKNTKTTSSKVDLVEGELTITKTEKKLETTGTENLNYTLKENEAIQIIYPNYYSDKTYSTYVNYKFVSPTRSVLKANSEYTLTSGQQLVLIYSQDGVQKQDLYTAGAIIRSSFDINPLTTGTKKSWYDAENFYHQDDAGFATLSSNQTISTRKLMKTVINATNLKCYWLMNNDSNKVDFVNNEKILESNEYFIYTNATKDEIMIFGAGTKLTCMDGTSTKSYWTIGSKPTSIESISENGLNAEIQWQNINFNAEPLTITEMAVITLNEGDSIIINGWTDMNEDCQIDNDWQKCNGSITYSQNGGDNTTLSATQDFYMIKSRLDVVMSPSHPQTLRYTASGDSKSAIQKITLGDSTEIKATDTNNIIQSSDIVSLIGGKNKDVDSNFYQYSEEEIKTSLAVNIDYTTKASDGFVSENTTGLRNYMHQYPLWLNTNGTMLIPIYLSNDEITLTVDMYKPGDTETTIQIGEYDGESTAYGDSITLSKKGVYFITPENENCNKAYLRIKYSIQGKDMGASADPRYVSPLVEVERFVISSMRIVEGLNSLLSSDENVSLNNVLARIKDMIKNSDQPDTKFYLTYEPEDSMKIDLNKYCKWNSSHTERISKAFDNPHIMFDVNNVASDKTLSQIDLRNSDIDVYFTMIQE